MSHFAVRFLEKSSHPFSCLTDESPCLSICTLKGIVRSFQQKNGKKNKNFFIAIAIYQA